MSDQQTIVHIQSPDDVKALSLLIQGIASGSVTADTCPVSVDVVDWLTLETSQIISVPTSFADISQRGWDQLGPMLSEMAAGNLETAANNFTAGITIVPFASEQGDGNV